MERPGCRQYLKRPARQRNPVLPARLHAFGRDRPDGSLKVDFIPTRPAHLVAPAGGERRKLKRELGRRRGSGSPHLHEGLGNLAVRQRAAVLHVAVAPR